MLELKLRMANKMMRQLYKAILVLWAFLFVPMRATAGWFGASNYDECILESMKGVTSDAAAGLIHRACLAKYPVKGPSDSEVPANVASQLDGRASYSYGYLKGNFYNGNGEWTITQITIALMPKTKNKSPDPTRRAKEYSVNVTVPPLTNSDFIVSVDNDGSSEFDWSISKVRGYKK